jgi:hypothetical protein
MVRFYPLNHLLVCCALESLYHSIYLSTYPKLDLCGIFSEYCVERDLTLCESST